MLKTILTVEDEIKNRKLLRDLLHVNGYLVQEATNGEEAVRMAKEERPDLILMDVQMPRMNGLKATRILKEDSDTKDIPVIVLTALAMEGDKERALAAGCDGYLSKPLNIHLLLKTVAGYLQEEER